MWRVGHGPGCGLVVPGDFWVSFLRCLRHQLGCGGKIVAGYLSNDLCAGALLSITLIALAGGCDHSRSAPQNATASSSEVSQALIGKQITIQGKFSLLGKAGPYVVLDKQQVVYLVSRGSFTWGTPYSEMEGKLVAATGTLRFFHSPESSPAGQTKARPPDYFYLEVETAQVRLIGR
jgi:hypothetical protein